MHVHVDIVVDIDFELTNWSGEEREKSSAIQ